MRKSFVIQAPVLKFEGEKWGSGKLVTYPISYQYNGGIVVKGEWYSGYEVPPPIVPPGFKLVNIGFGLELNARPPFATALMVKDDGK